MNSKEIAERAEKLIDLKEQLEETLDEIKEALKGTPEESRAKAYWVAHIRCALDNDHDYLGGSMETMADTIEALEERADESEDDPAPTCADCGHEFSYKELKEWKEEEGGEEPPDLCEECEEKAEAKEKADDSISYPISKEESKYIDDIMEEDRKAGLVETWKIRCTFKGGMLGIPSEHFKENGAVVIYYSKEGAEQRAEELTKARKGNFTEMLFTAEKAD
jgi:hypothetical protein